MAANFFAVSGIATSFLVVLVTWGVQAPPSLSRVSTYSSLSTAAKAKLDEARQFLLQGNTDAAAVSVQEGLRLAPRSVEGYNLLGLIYDRKRRFDESAKAFQKALDLDPNSPITHTNLGMSYFSQRKFELAEREFRA